MLDFTFDGSVLDTRSVFSINPISSSGDISRVIFDDWVN
jgi:acyl-CoA hydrolase